MTNLIINGAAGRMGTTIIRLSKEEPDLKIVGAVGNARSPDIGKDAGIKADIGNIGVEISGDLSEIISKADVVIDFSSPASTHHAIETAMSAKKALVVGTTGHTDEEKKIFAKAAKKIPLLVSPNMCVGVNLLWKMAEMTGKTLGKNYQINIVERHHIHKKDAPSGTAKKLIEVVTEASGFNIDKDVFFSLDSSGEAASTKPITVKAVREGEVVGDHTLYFTSKEDRIELAHFAFTRDIFAKGALRAARWIVDKPTGLYDMQDVLF
jgi:4-hydroxy-tetrahydrodipicolinate reductase